MFSEKGKIMNSKEVYFWANGEWVAALKPDRTDRDNFLICSNYGTSDWSGFRTLENCLSQTMNNNRPDGYYTIVER